MSPRVRKPLMTLVVASAVAAGCARRSAESNPTPGDPPAPTLAPTLVPALAPIQARAKSAARLLLGTWRVDAFDPASPSATASAAKLNENVGSAAAAAVRVAYTGTQVKVLSPGKPVVTSSYSVRSDAPDRCVLLSGKDTVEITFTDDDHMTIDRKGNAYASKMRMRRVVEEPAGRTDAGLSAPPD